MTRLRADLHRRFANSPFLDEVRDRLSKTEPEDLMKLLGVAGLQEKSTLSEGNDNAIFEYDGEEVIDDIEKALKKSKVDLTQWEVDRKEFKTYTVTMKLKRTKKEGEKTIAFHEPVQKTNYYCKISFKRKSTTWEDIEKALRKSLKKKVKLRKRKEGKGVGVVSIADLHTGAEIKDLVATDDFDINILSRYLQEFANKVNDLGYEEVHLNVLGDLVESISGLNHPNSWKSLGDNMYGYNVIIIAFELIRDNLLLKIDNLKEVNILPGNHDRFTIDKKVDNVGGLGGLMAYMITLGVEGLKVNYNDLVLVREIDGINYIMTHGDKAMTKDAVKMIADYGLKDKYNVILSAHLHSRKKKTTKKVEYKDQNHINIDSLNYRALVVPSMFTGNFYSESLGYTSSAGGLVTENNGSGKINTFDYTL